MIRKFRSRYPQGSLISELLTIKQGKYVVRVMVQENGITLGTGLGAADSLEQAEDTARMRALSTLDLNYNPTTSIVEPKSSVELSITPAINPPQPLETLTSEVKPVVAEVNHHSEPELSSVTEPSQPSKKTKSVANKPKPDQTSLVWDLPVLSESPETTSTLEIAKPVTTSTPVIEVPEPVTTSTPVIEVPEPVTTSTPVIEVPEPVTTSTPVIEVPGPVTTSTPVIEVPEPVTTSTPVTEVPEPVTTSTPVTEVPEPVSTSTPFLESPEVVAQKEPISQPKDSVDSAAMLDYSDIIARTDIELKRLGWGKEEGRKHLIETYGKKSRHVLSDGELLEFLHYLESLPTPY